MGIIRKKRIKYAFKFGKIEHKYGRLIGLCVGMNYASFYWFPSYNKYLIPITFITWMIYLMSHKIEKKLFGKNGPRSGWGKK